MQILRIIRPRPAGRRREVRRSGARDDGNRRSPRADRRRRNRATACRRSRARRRRTPTAGSRTAASRRRSGSGDRRRRVGAVRCGEQAAEGIARWRVIGGQRAAAGGDGVARGVVERDPQIETRRRRRRPLGLRRSPSLKPSGSRSRRPMTVRRMPLSTRRCSSAADSGAAATSARSPPSRGRRQLSDENANSVSARHAELGRRFDHPPRRLDAGAMARPSAADRAASPSARCRP